MAATMSHEQNKGRITEGTAIKGNNENQSEKVRG